jgi:hypothetical protein
MQERGGPLCDANYDSQTHSFVQTVGLELNSDRMTADIFKRHTLFLF